MTKLRHLIVIHLQLFLILRIGIAQHTDGRDAQPQQIAITLRGITLEIAVQRTFPLRLSQLIVRFGKMIHADVEVALRGQVFDGFLQHRQFFRRRWQQLFLDFVLSGKTGWQVRVVEHRQAIGL